MTATPIVIDGSQGEGGGQILRTSVGLAAALGKCVRVSNIRAGRQRPGLRPQHLAAIRAAAATCNAELAGAEIGSMDITFRPGELRAGQYRFDIGTAGSAILVLQTVIPALVLAEGDSDVTVTGGTHNPLAPCFEYLRDVFAVLASAANIQMHVEMMRPGFYPTGGGEVRMQIRGVGSAENIEPLVLIDRGEVRHIEGLSAASYSLAAHIIERQTSQALSRLAATRRRATIEQAVWETFSPGTVVFLRAVFAKSVAGVFSLGARSKRAERVADEAVEELLAFIDSPGVVDAHAADQLLTLLALCPYESRYVTERLTDHLRTNAWAITRMTGRQIDIEPGEEESATVTVRQM
ncbi:MAG: RNA 3'-terminal phosphate cyclase [Phycisphaerae bacterium]